MGKNFIKIPTLTFVLVIMVALNVVASLGFSMSDAKPEEVKRMAKYFTRISSPISLNPIRSFDVNSNGEIILGLYSSRIMAIHVYDQDMNFKYGYTFNSGGSFGSNWDGNKVALYLNRQSFAIYFDENGNVDQGKEIANSIENSRYWNDVVFATRRTVNGVKYELRNNFGLFNILTLQSYAQLVKHLPNGTTEILYDASDVLLSNIIVTTFIILAFVIIGVLVIRKFLKDLDNARKEKE